MIQYIKRTLEELQGALVNSFEAELRHHPGGKKLLDGIHRTSLFNEQVQRLRQLDDINDSYKAHEMN